MKILIAEDDQHILNGLAEVFESEGYEVLKASDGRQALALFFSQSPDFACLDIMMPGINGYDVCRQIRKHSPGMPVIFITAKSEEVDKVVGLELGADDYIVKPFSVREVVARIRAVTRRTLAARAAVSCESAPSFHMGSLVVLPDELRARRGNQFMDLSLRDVRILHVLHQNAGKVVSRQALFCAAWGMDHLPNSRALDQHISQLRKRVEEDPAHPALIQTVHGAGYRYDPGEA